MSENYVICCNNTADLPLEFLQKNAVPVANLGYSIDNREYIYGEDIEALKEFYQLMREGKPTKTTQVNPEEAVALFEPLLQQGKDILHIAFSSGLSGTYNSMKIAAEELSEKYPERRVVVVDSLSASLGEGLLVYKALKMKNEGATLDEIVNWLVETRLRLCHYLTVDDLNHLYRGGRVSKTAAVFGTVLGIKPILRVDDEGKLIPIAKIRGRRQSLIRLVEYMEELTKNTENDLFFISHGDCYEDAEFVAKLIQERLGIKNYLINHIGTTTGSHAGPGTIALFFLGDHR